jgi:hypothetical protein
MDAMKKVGLVLAKLKPFALANNIALKLQMKSSSPDVSILTRIVGNETWVMAVNTANKTLKPTFSRYTRPPLGTITTGVIGLPCDTLRPLSVATDGSFTDTIEPFGTRVYRLSIYVQL